MQSAAQSHATSKAEDATRTREAHPTSSPPVAFSTAISQSNVKESLTGGAAASILDSANAL